MWLKRVAADLRQSAQSKGIRAQLLFRSFVEIAHDVHFAFAAGARTFATQFFQRDESLGSILPLQGEFIANLLNIGRSHESRLPEERAGVQKLGITKKHS